MLKRILKLVVLLPLALLLVALAVSNRHPVSLVLDPFRGDPGIAVALPFYVFLFGALIVGVLIGGLSVWMSQGHWRRTATRRMHEAQRWHAEAARLAAERDANVAGSATAVKQLAAAGR